MNQFVLHYIATDGYTYDCPRDIPFYYSSAEQASVDFDSLCLQHTGEFTFANHTLHSSTFYIDGIYTEPQILTLEEWWKYYSK